MKRLVKMAVGGAFCLLFAVVAFSIAYSGATSGMPRAAGDISQIGLLVTALVLAISGLALLVKSVVRVFDR